MAVFKDDSKIKVRVFIEVMGWPAEGLTEHLKKIMTILQEKSNWKISKEDYAEPTKVGEKTFTTHVEFEGEAPDLPALFMFSMLYGPSVIEILEPSEFYVTAGEMQDILSDAISKVQSMDKEIKVLASQNKKLNQLFKVMQDKGIIQKKPPEEKPSTE